MAIKYCALDPSRYKGHSFRIGAASYPADAAMSDSQIRALGHWKSDAFHKYIRMPSLSTELFQLRLVAASSGGGCCFSARRTLD